MNKTNKTRRDYYQQEILALSEEAKHFAQAFPKIAGRLTLDQENARDPHVERLIQSVAFLCGRIRQDLDKEHERLADNLLESLYPHLLHPIPSMSIARVTADARNLPSLPQDIDSGHPLVTQNMEGTKCHFRTCYPVQLWPLEVSAVNMNEESSLLSLTCKHINPTDAQPLRLDRLRFYIHSDHRNAFALYEMLFMHSQRLSINEIDGAHPATNDSNSLSIQPVGFASDESVLPYPAVTHHGYRLIQEYISFPEKFLFFDICFKNPINLSNSLTCHIEIDSEQGRQVQVNNNSFKLGCTPVINLFERISEPLRINAESSEYPVIADQLSNKSLGIHSVQSVNSADKNAPYQISPYLSQSPESNIGYSHLYWIAHRRATTQGLEQGLEQERITLSLINENLPYLLENTVTLYATLLCTNQQLPLGLTQGSPLFSESSLPGINIELCQKPTAPIHTPAPDKRRKLISMLSLNHFSILCGNHGLQAFKTLLAAHDLNEKGVSSHFFDGITDIQSQSLMMRINDQGRPVFCRGLNIDLVLEPMRFSDESAFLLASILNHFFSMYATINTVTRLTLHQGKLGTIWKQWQPRCGDRTLL